MTTYVKGRKHFRRTRVLHPQGTGRAELRNEGDDSVAAEDGGYTKLLRGLLG